MVAKANTTIDKKNIAKTLYLSNYTQEEIAEKVGSSRQTIARWIKQNGWEELRASASITPDKIIANFQRQIMEINNNIAERETGKRFATVAESDTLVKLAAAIQKLEQDIGIADIVNVAIKFTSWLRSTDIDMCKAISPFFDTFIKSQIKH